MMRVFVYKKNYIHNEKKNKKKKEKRKWENMTQTYHSTRPSMS